MEIMTASRQWATRPDDQRFANLIDLHAFTNGQFEISRGKVVSSREIQCQPIAEDNERKSLVVVGPNGGPTVPTNWAFGQLAKLVGAPAGFLRTLPADITADALNYKLARRPVEDVGVLLRKNGGPAELAAATGPNYGRVWNRDITAGLVKRFGNGIDGDFTVPGEFGQKVEIDKRNTTLYASDRDMFVFLADEKNRIEVPGRRPGRTGEMARGFFVWNSEVGDCTFGIATFLFDYVCCNRIVWGAQGYEEIKIRHTKSAPDRWIEEVAPAIEAYANKETASIRTAIEDARSKRFREPAEVTAFLEKRFTKTQASAISAVHMAEEDRPIETLWDVTVGATAYARGITHTNDRVRIEREAGKIMAMAQ